MTVQRSLALVLLVTSACSSPSPAPDARPEEAAIPDLSDGGRDQAIDAAADLAPDMAADLLAPDADSGPGCPSGSWCSELYPPGWTPDHPVDWEGRFLHDFSYAGYRNGESPLPASPPGQTFDAVAGFGADNSGSGDATAAIQSAIDAAVAAGGGIVYLPAGSYRCDGALDVPADRIVLRGAGAGATKIHFSNAASMSNKSHITLRGQLASGAEVPLASDGETRSKVVEVADASSLAVGDDVAVGWVITPEFVAEHGMTGTWNPAFIGQWKAFFRRAVVAIDTSVSPAEVTLDVPLRYPAQLRDGASIRRESGYAAECGVEHLSISNAVAWDDAWSQTRVHLVALRGVKDCWVRDVRSTESPFASGWSGIDTRKYHLQSGGIYVLDSKRVTVSGCAMHNAQHRGGGGNGYLFEVSRSNEVLFESCEAVNGRHNFIQNWDFGTAGCVFLRCTSRGSAYVTMILGIAIATPAYCEYHHSLALATLVDSCQLEDGWIAHNRGGESSGAGHTASGCVVWNATGGAAGGKLISMQYGWGYVIGTDPQMTVDASLLSLLAVGTAPEDWVEGHGLGATLWPQSLYEDQLARRLAAP